MGADPNVVYPPEVEVIVSTFTNPKYYSGTDPTNPIIIDCTISGAANTYLALSNDPMPYGVDIYNRAVAEEWGSIAPYIVPVPVPPTQQQLMDYANLKVNTLRTNSRTYDVFGNGTNTVQSDTTDGTIADVNQNALWATGNITLMIPGSVAPTPTAPTPGGTVNWVDDTYTTIALTANAAGNLGDLTRQYKQSLYDTLATTITGIQNGSILTFDDIDNIVWPT
jgi:hypothetical protein